MSILPGEVQAGDYTNLNMLAKGTIKDQNGVVLHSDVWFTTFISTDDITLNIGQNTWNQPGYAMVWGTTGEPSDITGAQKYVPLSSGNILVIDRLYKEGQAVTSIHLGPTAYEPVVPDLPDTAPATPQPDTTDAETQGAGNQTVQILSWGFMAILVVVSVITAGFVGWFVARRKK